MNTEPSKYRCSQRNLVEVNGDWVSWADSTLAKQKELLAELREAIRQHKAARWDYDETYSDDDVRLWEVLGGGTENDNFVDDSRDFIDRENTALQERSDE
jgi:hypothetical protein